MKKITYYGKIGAILLFAVVLTRVSGALFFPDNTPQVKLNNVKTLASNIQSFFSFGGEERKQKDQTEKLIERIAGDTSKMIAPGVYAAEEGNVSVTYLQEKEVEWVSTTFTLANGKKITVQFPRGTQAPSQEMFEGMD